MPRLAAPLSVPGCTGSRVPAAAGRSSPARRGIWITWMCRGRTAVGDGGSLVIGGVTGRPVVGWDGPGSGRSGGGRRCFR
jgi:hypothetical protein